MRIAKKNNSKICVQRITKTRQSTNKTEQRMSNSCDEFGLKSKRSEYMEKYKKCDKNRITTLNTAAQYRKQMKRKNNIPMSWPMRCVEEWDGYMVHTYTSVEQLCSEHYMRAIE